MPAAVRGQVKAREDKIVLPTYEVGPAEPNPIFYSGRASPSMPIIWGWL